MKYLNEFHKKHTDAARQELKTQKPLASLEEILKIMKETSKGTRFSLKQNLGEKR